MATTAGAVILDYLSDFTSFALWQICYTHPKTRPKRNAAQIDLGVGAVAAGRAGGAHDMAQANRLYVQFDARSAPWATCFGLWCGSVVGRGRVMHRG